MLVWRLPCDHEWAVKWRNCDIRFLIMYLADVSCSTKSISRGSVAQCLEKGYIGIKYPLWPSMSTWLFSVKVMA